MGKVFHRNKKPSEGDPDGQKKVKKVQKKKLKCGHCHSDDSSFKC